MKHFNLLKFNTSAIRNFETLCKFLPDDFLDNAELYDTMDDCFGFQFTNIIGLVIELEVQQNGFVFISDAEKIEKTYSIEQIPTLVCKLVRM